MGRIIVKLAEFPPEFIIELDVALSDELALMPSWRPALRLMPALEKSASGTLSEIAIT